MSVIFFDEARETYQCLINGAAPDPIVEFTQKFLEKYGKQL